MARQTSTSWIDVQKEFSSAFTRQELQEMRKKFQSFDANELKLAMEKMGNPQTHVQLKEMMQAMAADPERGVTLHDFFAVQLAMKGVDPTKATASHTFVKALTDYTPQGIINFHEQIAKQQELEKDHERKIKEEAAERKAKAEEKRENKKNFKNKMAMFEQK